MDCASNKGAALAEQITPPVGIWPQHHKLALRDAVAETFPAGFESSFAEPQTRFRQRRIAVVGATEAASRLLRSVRYCHPVPAHIIGVFDEHPDDRVGWFGGTMRVRALDELIAHAKRNHVDLVILALPASEPEQIRSVLNHLSTLSAEIAIIDETSSYPAAPGRRLFLAGEPLRMLIERPISRPGAALKRAMDILLAAAALIVLAPLMLLLALLIRLETPGDALFRQQRIGFNNRPFTMLKFRTMVADAADQEGAFGTRRRDPRVTRLGRILRRYSLDELPQLLNVLGGSMSIVGPRPHTKAMQIGAHPYSEAVPAYPQRHRMKPGLTGWAQINGSRGGIHTLEKAAWAAAMDLEYVQRWSLWLDISIIARTIGLVLSGRGAL